MIPLLTREAASKAQRIFLQRAPALNLFAHLAHAPSLGGRIAALGEAVMADGGAVSADVREFIALRVGIRRGSTYVAGLHRRIAQSIGIDPKVIAFACGERDEPPEDDVVYGALAGMIDDVLHGRPPRAADLESLTDYMGAEGAVSAAVMTGYFSMIAAVTVALGTPLDPYR